MLSAPGRFTIREIPAPEPVRKDHVLIHVKSVGICGSDLHYFRSGTIGDQQVSFPFVIGHECTGVIGETGKAVASVRTGDRITVDPAISCGTCDQCLAGRFHTCRCLQFLGCPGQMHGALAEGLVMPESCCYVLPERLQNEVAVFAEPMSVALQAWQMLAGCELNTMGILGAGPIGISVFLVSQLTGSVRVFVTDKVDARLASARSLGAHGTANPDKVDIVRAAGEELDAVFECCGQEEAIHQAAQLLKPGGHLVIAGIPESRKIGMDPHLFRRKEIHIHHVRRQNGKLREAIDICLEQQEQIRPLITHRFPLDDVQQAFELTGDYRDSVMKTVIDCQ